MPFEFEKLIVYQKSIGFAESVCLATRRFPRDYHFLANQLKRAGLSIPANIAEGSGRFTSSDRRKYFGIARGSVQECVPLLELAARIHLLTPDAYARLRSDLEDISRMVSGLIRSLARQR